jgi:hypothetical protein
MATELVLPELESYKQTYPPHGWYPPICHLTNKASWASVQYRPPGGMEAGWPLCGDNVASTAFALLGFDMQL